MNGEIQNILIRIDEILVNKENVPANVIGTGLATLKIYVKKV